MLSSMAEGAAEGAAPLIFPFLIVHAINQNTKLPRDTSTLPGHEFYIWIEERETERVLVPERGARLGNFERRSCAARCFLTMTC